MCLESWLEAVYACRGTLAIVRLNMEESGVNTPLVFDLSAIDASLDRMEMLVATLAGSATHALAAARRLLDTLACGQLEDVRVAPLIRHNFTCWLARPSNALDMAENITLPTPEKNTGICGGRQSAADYLLSLPRQSNFTSLGGNGRPLLKQCWWEPTMRSVFCCF